MGTDPSLVAVDLKRCTRCGFYITLDEFHADNLYREDQKDVWCKGCKHNSKIQAKYLGSAGRHDLPGTTISAQYLGGKDGT